MISKERLEELIKQNVKIYYFDKDNDEDWDIEELNTKHIRYSHNEDCYIHFDRETWETNPKPYKVFEYNLFETKEEAEFVSNFHTKRQEEFNPPYKLKTGEQYRFTSKKGAKMSIYRRSDDEWWLCYVGTHRLCNSYKEAVQRARNYFLGK